MGYPTLTPDEIRTHPLFSKLSGRQQIFVDELLKNGNDKIAAAHKAWTCNGDESARTMANRALQDERVVVMGTLSKSFGTLGGFVAGPKPLIELLQNAARSFIFDTALPPALATAARIAIYIARGADDRRARIAAVTKQLREGVAALGYPAAAQLGPIVPVVIGPEERAKAIEHRLLEEHIYAPAVRPPTVPPGTSRLRLSVRSDHKEIQIEQFLEALRCSATS